MGDFIDCFKKMVKCVDEGKYEIALLRLEEMIPTIPRNIGNDIFLTDFAQVPKQTSIQRRLEILAELLGQGQSNEDENRMEAMSRADAVQIVTSVMKKFDLEEQWQILRRLPGRYHSEVHEAFGFDDARRLLAIEYIRKILIELYDTSTKQTEKEKVARKLQLPKNPPVSQLGKTIVQSTGLPEFDLSPDNEQDDEAKRVIGELLDKEEFWPVLLQNPDLNVFAKLSKRICEEYQFRPQNALNVFGELNDPRLQAEWEDLFSMARAYYHAGGRPPLADLLTMRRLLRQAWLKSIFGIEWEREKVSPANSPTQGFKNLMSMPLKKVTLKVGLAEVLDSFADENKPLREEFSYHAQRAGVSNPLPVIYSPESPDVSGIVKMPLQEVLQPSGYTLIQLEPAEILSSISQRHDALLAINDGFFVVQGAEFQEGHAAIMSPVGFLLVDAKVLVPPTVKRAALLIDENNKPCIGFVSMKDIRIKLVDVRRIFIDEKETKLAENEDHFTLAPFNQRHFNPKNNVILYTSRFGDRTLQEFNRVQIGILHNRIIFLHWGHDERNVSSPILQNGFVISYPIREDTAKKWEESVRTKAKDEEEPKKKAMETSSDFTVLQAITNEQQAGAPGLEVPESWLLKLKIGGKVKLTLTSYYNLKGGKEGVSYDGSGGRAIVQGFSCGPLLLAKEINYIVEENFWDPKHVENEEDWSEEFILEHLFPSNVDRQWIQKLHPRTAIGIKESKIAMVVYDGDKKIFGQSITGLAMFLTALNWEVGINLDGGSSSSMLAFSNVENVPSYKGRERLIATGIMVLPKEIPVQCRFRKEVRRWLAEQKGADKMNLNDLLDSEPTKELVGYKIRKKFHENLTTENMNLLSRGVYSQEFVEHLNQEVRELLKPDFHQFLTTDESQIVAGLAGNLMVVDWIDAKLPAILEELMGLQSKIYLRQERLVPLVTIFDWDKKVQLSDGTTGIVGMKFFEEVVKHVWKETKENCVQSRYLESCLIELKREFSESFKVTEQSLKNLKSERVPNDVLEKLESIKDKEITEESLVGLIKETIKDEETVELESLILKYAEFSGEELHKFWCFEERYKERQGIGEIIDAYKNKQSGWPDQLDEKQVQCSLKETRDVFFYYLFYALLNRYKKLKNQGCEFESKEQFRVIVKTIFTESKEKGAEDLLLKRLLESFLLKGGKGL